jgi:hypothetical protein
MENQDLIQKEDGKYDYVCCTIAPFNIPSLKDKFAQGIEIAALKEWWEYAVCFCEEFKGR